MILILIQEVALTVEILSCTWKAQGRPSQNKTLFIKKRKCECNYSIEKQIENDMLMIQLHSETFFDAIIEIFSGWFLTTVYSKRSYTEWAWWSWRPSSIQSSVANYPTNWPDSGPRSCVKKNSDQPFLLALPFPIQTKGITIRTIEDCYLHHLNRDFS